MATGQALPRILQRDWRAPLVDADDPARRASAGGPRPPCVQVRERCPTAQKTRSWSSVVSGSRRSPAASGSAPAPVLGTLVAPHVDVHRAEAESRARWRRRSLVQGEVTTPRAGPRHCSRPDDRRGARAAPRSRFLPVGRVADRAAGIRGGHGSRGSCRRRCRNRAPVRMVPVVVARLGRFGGTTSRCCAAPLEVPLSGMEVVSLVQVVAPISSRPRSPSRRPRRAGRTRRWSGRRSARYCRRGCGR